MNRQFRPSLLLPCALPVIITGCTAPSINDARYSKGGIYVDLTCSSNVTDARIPVTGQQIADLHQKESLVTGAPASLKTGRNKSFLPAPPGPGSYKDPVYLTRSSQRTTAVLRDIVVNDS